jgi:hypothetical protein
MHRVIPAVRQVPTANGAILAELVLLQAGNVFALCTEDYGDGLGKLGKHYALRLELTNSVFAFVRLKVFSPHITQCESWNCTVFLLKLDGHFGKHIMTHNIMP